MKLTEMLGQYEELLDKKDQLAKDTKADTPMILNLFIPIREYGEAERMIREKRGYVYSAYAEAQKFKLERGGKN